MKKHEKLVVLTNITIIVIIAVCVIFVFMAFKEDFKRGIKSLNSDLNGGLNRTITVYSNTGEVLEKYSGKCDIESNESKVLFDMDGKRVIIYNAIVIAEEN